MGNTNATGDGRASGANVNGRGGEVATAASQLVALQLYAAVLDDIRAKALSIVEWAEDSIREFEAVTSGTGKGGTDAAE